MEYKSELLILLLMSVLMSMLSVSVDEDNLTISKRMLMKMQLLRDVTSGVSSSLKSVLNIGEFEICTLVNCT